MTRQKASEKGHQARTCHSALNICTVEGGPGTNTIAATDTDSMNESWIDEELESESDRVLVEEALTEFREQNQRFLKFMKRVIREMPPPPIAESEPSDVEDLDDTRSADERDWMLSQSLMDY